VKRATVWCADCTVERRRDRTKLGEVVVRDGVPVWLALGDPRTLRNWRKVTPSNVHAPWVRGKVQEEIKLAMPDSWVPYEWLPAWCEHHGGEGSIPASDVINASGSVVVKLRPGPRV